MNRHEALLILFAIAKEIERSYEIPVILLTQNDYADNIFKSLADLRSTLLDKTQPKRVAEIVNTFHIEWLQAVQDIVNFKKRVSDLPRETIFRAVDFTIESTLNRYTHFRNYIEYQQFPMPEEEKSLLQANLSIIKDMHKIVHCALLEKREHLQNQADKAEFYDRIIDEIEELLNWLDNLYDHLANQFSNILNLKIPLSTSDLTKPLKQIIEEVSQEPDSQVIVKEIKDRGKILSSMIRVSCHNELELSKVVNNIKILEKRISQLEDPQSCAVMALKHRTIYLEERLMSLENIKLSLCRLRAMSDTYTYEDCLYVDQAHIFNHLLPIQERCRLVEQLVKAWNNSIGHVPQESIVSILSVADLKDVFSDDIGQFTVDKYGRKIYTKYDDSLLYQLNENRELVTVKDDIRHVYFYDGCGRYFLDKNRQRVYKAYAEASEYVMNREGNLLKTREERNNVVYSYDNLGRYYINDYGRRIYRSEDSVREYDRDRFGNLLKIRAGPVYETCPDTEELTEMSEMTYLKETLGEALRKCMADVVLHQPDDPIAYLANSLENYSYNMSARQLRILQEQEMAAERDLRKVIEPTHEHMGENSIHFYFSQEYVESQNLELNLGED